MNCPSFHLSYIITKQARYIRQCYDSEQNFFTEAQVQVCFVGSRSRAETIWTLYSLVCNPHRNITRHGQSLKHRQSKTEAKTEAHGGTLNIDAIQINLTWAAATKTIAIAAGGNRWWTTWTSHVLSFDVVNILPALDFETLDEETGRCFFCGSMLRTSKLSTLLRASKIDWADHFVGLAVKMSCSRI